MVVLSTSSPIEIILYKFQMSSVSSGVNLMVPGRFLVKCPQYPFMCRVEGLKGKYSCNKYYVCHSYYLCYLLFVIFIFYLLLYKMQVSILFLLFLISV